MAWCPSCRMEYEADVTTCSDCGAALVDAQPAGDEPVVALHATSATEAQIAEATLEAEGIDAYAAQPSVVLPQYDNVVADVTNELDVLVAPEDAARAAEVLNSAPVTDAELEAAEEAGAGGESAA